MEASRLFDSSQFGDQSVNPQRLTRFEALPFLTNAKPTQTFEDLKHFTRCFAVMWTVKRAENLLTPVRSSRLCQSDYKLESADLYLSIC